MITFSKLGYYGAIGNQLFQYFFTRSLKQEDYSFDISFYNFNSSRKLDLINFPNLKLKFIHCRKQITHVLFPIGMHSWAKNCG